MNKFYQCAFFLVISSTLASFTQVDVQMIIVKSNTEERFHLDNTTAHSTFISWFQNEVFTRVRDVLKHGICKTKNNPEITFFKMTPVQYTTVQLFSAVSSGDFVHSQILINILLKHQKSTAQKLASWFESNFKVSETNVFEAATNFVYLERTSLIHSFIQRTSSASIPHQVKQLFLILSENHHTLSRAVHLRDYSTALWLVENNVTNINKKAAEILWGEKMYNILDTILFGEKKDNKELISHLVKNDSFLEYAVNKGKTDILQYLYEDETLNKCIFLIASLDLNKTESINSFIDNFGIDMNWNCMNSSIVKLLHSSVMMERFDITRMLVNFGINIDTVDSNGYTPLTRALFQNKIDAVNFLVTSGANYNFKTRFGKSIMSLCVEERQVPCVRRLLNMGADPILPNDNGFTPLEYIVKNDETDTLKIATKRIPNIKDMVIKGSYLLHHAVANGSQNAVRTLLEEGFDSDRTDGYDHTPMALAVIANDTLKILYLVEFDADVNARDANGDTPLHVSLMKSTLSVTKTLCVLGADIHATNNIGETPIFTAVKENNHEAIPFLIKKGANVRMGTGHGGTLLHTAAEFGSVKAFEVLLSYYLILNSTNDNQESPLIVAVKSNKPEIVKLIVNKGGDVNEKTEKEYTLLHIAVLFDSIDCLPILLDFGLDIYALNKQGESPLTIAILKNDYAMLKTILNFSKNFIFDVKDLVLASSNGCLNSLKAMKEVYDKFGIGFAREHRSGISPLAEAVKANRVEVVRYFKENGANMGYKTRNNDSLVHLASSHGSFDVLKLLLDWGLDADCLNKNYETPIWLATKYGHFDAMLLLHEKGANLSVRSTYEPWEGGTLLHPAAFSGNAESLSWLLSKSLNVNEEDEVGETPLHIASEIGSKDVALSLLEAGADVNKADVTGSTPLHKAAFQGHFKVVEALLEFGADLDPKIKGGITPLLYAASNGHFKIVELLLENGVEKNVQDSMGLSPLHWATYKRHPEVVSALMKNGIDAALSDNRGRTSAQLAEDNGYAEILAILQLT